MEHTALGAASEGGASKATGRVPVPETENEQPFFFLGVCQQEQWPHLAGVTAHGNLDCWTDFRS